MTLLQLRVESGEEVIQTLNERLAQADIRAGAIVSLIGAINSCTISNMPSQDESSNTLTDYSLPFELSGTGEVVDGKAHLHVTISSEGDIARHGHLHRATVGSWFVAAYVVPA